MPACSARPRYPGKRPAIDVCVQQSTLTLQLAHTRMGASFVAYKLTVHHAINCPGHRICGVSLPANYLRLDVSILQLCTQWYMEVHWYPKLTHPRVGEWASPVVVSVTIYPGKCPNCHRIAGMRLLTEIYPCIRGYDPLPPVCIGLPTLTLQLAHTSVGASPLVFSLTYYHGIYRPGCRNCRLISPTKYLQWDIIIAPTQ